MTAATLARSSGAITSFSTSDAMISTSYGVRFFDFAYETPTWFQFSWNAASCCFTSCFDVVRCSKSYVEGKRKPSSERRLPSCANGRRGVELFGARRYAADESLGLILRF